MASGSLSARRGSPGSCAAWTAFAPSCAATTACATLAEWWWEDRTCGFSTGLAAAAAGGVASWRGTSTSWTGATGEAGAAVSASDMEAAALAAWPLPAGARPRAFRCASVRRLRVRWSSASAFAFSMSSVCTSFRDCISSFSFASQAAWELAWSREASSFSSLTFARSCCISAALLFAMPWASWSLSLSAWFCWCSWLFSSKYSSSSEREERTCSSAESRCLMMACSSLWRARSLPSTSSARARQLSLSLRTASYSWE
mmetsp:Transcript_39332/g.116567  ORF Transcript_39332/g.116567 Transcript_39332/m.116567 type:complete len:258 (+) Transcript_39332:198-971(+)